jgi:hypothetical protein
MASSLSKYFVCTGALVLGSAVETGCGGRVDDRSPALAKEIAAPDASTGDSGGSSEMGTSTASEVGSCGDWTEEATFAGLTSQGYALGRVYGAWASAENDIHVALGVEDASWPSSIHVAAVASWDGSSWRVAALPPTGAIAAISGSSASDLWVLSAAPDQPGQFFRNTGAGGAWIASNLPTGFGAAFDLVVLGPGQALLSARPDYDLTDSGTLLRLQGSDWTPVDLPPDNQPYTIMQLRARDPMHVSAIGYQTAAAMGNYVLDSLDGKSWTSARIAGLPSSTLPSMALDDVVTTSQSTYASVSVYDGGVGVYTVEGSTWTQSATMGGFADSHALVASSTGTVMAIWATYMVPGSPASIAILRGGAVSYATPSLGWGNLVAVVPPGSRCAHVFAGAQAGITLQGAHHWTYRLDP